MWSGLLIGLLAGVILGAALLYVVLQGRHRALLEQERGERDAEKQDLVQRLRAAEVAVADREELLRGQAVELSTVKQRAAAMEERIAAHREEVDTLNERLRERELAVAQHQRAVVDLTADLATTKQRNTDLNERMERQRAELEELNKRMEERFKLIADDLLERKGAQLNERQKETLAHVLDPFKERIREFEEQVKKAYTEEGQQRFALKSEIAKLVEQNQRLSQEADNLTKALKGDSRSQGAWGEMLLEKLLESAGLVKGQEFSMQESTTLESGDRLRPDAVVNLPEEKYIVIDSKVSLLAYDAYTAATDDAERQRYVKAHVDSLRAHAKGLAGKEYAKLYGIGSVDFVLMFVPIEPAFLLALRERPELFQEAYESGVVLVTNTTLLATLRTVASIWRNEKIARNHQDIAKRAGELYDKFVGFTEDMIKVGQQMDLSKRTYSDAMGKLTEGRGNLVRQVEMLKELGARTNKTINPALLSRADDSTGLS